MSKPTPAPSPLGLKKSFGYGDRLGLATPGHLAVHRKFDYAPVFAQQSIREMTRTNRTPEEVMASARDVLRQAGFTGEWGADADHLKTPEDARRTSDAGFCFFTIDPSDHVENRADRLGPFELAKAVRALKADRVFGDFAWLEAYAGKTVEVEGEPYRFSRTEVERAAVKYGRAIAHTAAMAAVIAEIRGGHPFEIEVSVDETDTPTSLLEHLFFGLELKRRGVAVVSLAPRFTGDFEKGIDYRGDLAEFEESLRRHVAIARHCGPYKISIHSGSDKFSIYPAIGRTCGDLLHVKTAGTGYLEGLRCVLRADPALFGDLVAYCVERFDTDKASYHISTTVEEVRALPKPRPGAVETEHHYLNERIGRQLLHVTFGSVLTVGKDSRGRAFKEAIHEVLLREVDLHHELLALHFEKHLSALNAG